MKKILLALIAVIPFSATADVVDTAPNSIFIYTPSNGQFKTQDGTVISSSTLNTMSTTAHVFNPGSPFLTHWWGIGHILDKPVTAVHMTSGQSDSSFVLKVKAVSVLNRNRYKPYYTSWGGFSSSKNLGGHNANTGDCSGSENGSSVGGTYGTKTSYNYSGWDENAASCTGKGRTKRVNNYQTLISNTDLDSYTSSNVFQYYMKLETPNGTPEPGTYTGSGQIFWRTKVHYSPDHPEYRKNTVNFTYTVIVEPEYHRVEAPSTVKFSKSEDPNHRKTSFYADVYGIFSPQMKVTATSANSTGTDFKMTCDECPTSYPTISDIQDITYDVDVTIDGVSEKFSLQSGVTSTIDLTRNSNGFYGGNGVAKVRFDIGYDRSDLTTKVATDLNYEDTLTLVFEPVI